MDTFYLNHLIIIVGILIEWLAQDDYAWDMSLSFRPTLSSQMHITTPSYFSNCHSTSHAISLRDVTPVNGFNPSSQYVCANYTQILIPNHIFMMMMMREDNKYELLG